MPSSPQSSQQSPLRTLLLAALLLQPLAALAQAEAFPSRAMRFIIPYPPGGITDTIGRLVGNKLSQDFNQTIIIDNRPGAGGVIGDDIVAKSAADGYTLLFTSPAVNMNIAIGRVMPYDLDRDLVPLMNVAWAPMILVTTPSANYKDAKDLVARAIASGGKTTYGSSGSGSPSHLTVELFRVKAGLRGTHIPYKGSPQALTDQIAGRFDFHFVNSATALPQIKAERVTALFVTASKRLAVAPNIPTNAEAGFPGVQASQFEAFFAPRGTPRAVLDKITAAVNKVLAMPDVIAAMAPHALEIDGASNPDKFAVLAREDRERWVAVAKSANIKAE